MNAVPATRGPIQSVSDSKSGKTLSVKVNDKFYSTKNWDFRNMVGATIEFVPDVSEWQGNTIVWINDYTTPAMTADDRMNQASASAPAATGPAQAPQATPTPNGDPMRYLPMTSNVVAHAIAAGVITKPNEIAAWSRAAFAAAKLLIEPAAAKVMGSSSEDFDDDIPF